MIKKLLNVWLPLVFFIALLACNNENENAVSQDKYDELLKTNEELNSQLSEKDSSFSSMIQYVNEINDNLALLNTKRLNIINNETGALDIDSSIRQNIKDIAQIMSENKNKISALNRKIKNSNVQLDGFEKMIQTLQNQVQEKNQEIFTLQNKLDDMGIAFDELMEAFKENQISSDSMQVENTKLTHEINKVYYAIGTAKELIANNIVEKDGGVAGIGSVKKLKNNLNKEYFTKANKSTLTEIPVGAKKATLITSHPEGSYEMVKTDMVQKIKITNPKAFWGNSDYAVIEVKM